MIKIPTPQKQYIQTGDSDTLGNLYATKNCDFDTNKGSVLLGKRLVLNTATEDVSELTSYPAGFKYFNNGSDSSFYTIAGADGVGYVFKSLAIDGNFAKVTTSGAPTTIDSSTSDIQLFQDATGLSELHISAADGKVYYLNTSNTWANITAGTTGYTGGTSMMALYGGRMYITKDGNKIQSYNRTHAVISPNTSGSDGANTNQYSATLPNSDEIIVCMRANSTGIFILGLNTKGGTGHVYFWNGSDVQINSQWRIDASGALAGMIKGEQLYMIDSNGVFGFMNAGTFTKLGQIWRKNNKPLFNPFYLTNQRFVHPNGMALLKEKISFLLDLTNYDAGSHNGTQEDCNPSGIWVYHENTGIKHKYSFGLSKQAGTIKDYGAFRIYGAGALSEILTAQSAVTNNGDFLAGCSYYTSATAVSSGIFYNDSNDTLQKAGYFITTKMSASADTFSIQDTWNKVYVFHEKFLTATDRFIVKYRTVESIPTEGAITWIDTTAFSTTLDLSGYEVGDEVEILQGVGTGLVSHITAIQASNGGYIVTVNETYTGATGTARARFDKWIKLGNIQDTKDFDDLSIDKNSSWIQFKVFMLWTGRNEFAEMIVTNKVFKKMV